MKYRFLLVLLGLCSLAFGQSTSWPLHTGWEFRQQGTEVWHPAQVPGVVQLDLLRLGLIPDPFVGTQEKEVQWVEDEAWEYQTTFSKPQGLAYPHYALLFEGLDTYATVYLNGQMIWETDNMFRQYRVEVAHLLQPENTLRIIFQSPMERHAQRLKEGIPYHKTAGNDARPEARVSVYTRKAPFQFGWDWGPRLVTSGIWQPVKLIGWGTAQLTQFHLHQREVTTQAVSGELEVQFEGTLPTGTELRLINTLNDSVWLRHQVTVPTMASLKLPYAFNNLNLWRPHTLGEPHRYPLRLELWYQEACLGQQSQSVGFRDIRLIQAADSIGTSFYFEVNGLPFYSMGANVIPPDALLPRATDTTWAQIVYDAHQAGMNMLRVWGGGIYPPESFYAACDSLGILVWQDFMFACSLYPADSAFLETVRQEARHQVTRLRVHPSLALWCGNNEIQVAWNNWGWDLLPGLMGAANEAQAEEAYRKLFQALLPSTVEQLDGSRLYVHTSPLSNWGKLENFNHGSMHYWGVWHGRDALEQFNVFVPRFMSEYGFQSFPEAATVAQFAPRKHWSLRTQVMKHHQKSYIGNGEIRTHLRRYYPRDRNFEDFLYKSQLTQARALEIAIEAHRRRAGHNMGTLYWQLNDTWPGPSWSTRDYYGRWKIAHYRVQQLYQPTYASATLADGTGTVWLHSTLPHPQTLRLTLQRLDFHGEETMLLDTTLVINPFAAMPNLFSFDYTDQEAENSVWVISLWGGDQLRSQVNRYAVAPKDLNLPKSQPEIQWVPEENLLILSSQTLIPDVWLEAEGISHWSQNGFTLLPNKAVRIQYQGPLSALSALRWRSWLSPQAQSF